VNVPATSQATTPNNLQQKATPSLPATAPSKAHSHRGDGHAKDPSPTATSTMTTPSNPNLNVATESRDKPTAPPVINTRSTASSGPQAHCDQTKPGPDSVRDAGGSQSVRTGPVFRKEIFELESSQMRNFRLETIANMLDAEHKRNHWARGCEEVKIIVTKQDSEIEATYRVHNDSVRFERSTSIKKTPQAPKPKSSQAGLLSREELTLKAILTTDIRMSPHPILLTSRCDLG
jgi:hypothetical protein